MNLMKDAKSAAQSPEVEDSALAEQPPGEKFSTSAEAAPQPECNLWRWPPQCGVRKVLDLVQGHRGHADTDLSCRSILLAVLAALLVSVGGPCFSKLRCLAFLECRYKH